MEKKSREIILLPPSLFVEANAYVGSGPTGTMISPATDHHFRTQEARFNERKFGEIPFKDIHFSLLTQDQIDAMKAATLIVSHHPVDAARALEYHRPDHELTTVDVTYEYYRFRQYGTLRSYLEASERIDKDEFKEQLDKIRELRKGEGPIEIPLVQQLTLFAIHSLDARVFYANFALNVEEPVLQAQLKGFAQDEVNIGTFLSGRIQTELAKDPKRSGEVNAALLGYESYGHDFVPDFQTRRAAMFKVSPPGLVRADLVKKAIMELVGEEHLLYLQEQRPFREKFAS